MIRSVTAISGESFNGLLHRWAVANSIDSMYDVTQHAGVNYRHVQDCALNEKRDLGTIAKITGLPIAELETRAMPLSPDGLSRLLFGVPVRKTDIEIRQRRFAPEALKLSAHHRAQWMVRTLPFSSETWEYLREDCHRADCGVTQRWTTTLGIERCDRCLADLRDAPSAYVPRDQRADLLAVANLLSANESERRDAIGQLPAGLATITSGAAYELVIRLMKFVHPTLPVARTGIQTASHGSLTGAMADAWRILRNWPEGFLDHAAQCIGPRLDRGDGNRGETMRLLSLWRNRSQLSDPIAFNVIKDISDAIDVSFPANASRLMPLKDAASALGIKQAHLSDLRRQGILQTKFAIRRDRPLAAFDREEIEELNAGWLDRVSFGTVQSHLGISAHGVEQMLALNLLDGLEHGYFAARYSSKSISKASLDRLTASLRERAEHLSEPVISLNKAMTAVGGRQKPWGRVFGLLAEGSVRFEYRASSRPFVDNVRVRRSDVPILANLNGKVRPGVSPAKYMSKQDAAEMLNLGPVQATRLLAEFVTLRGTRAVVVPSEIVQDYAEKYMSTAELSWALGVSQQAARSQARRAKVTQVRPAGFLRSEAIERLNLKA